MEQPTRKLTRKRCPPRTRFDKNLNDCVPIRKENTLFPSNLLGKILNIQKTEKKRCGKGLHFNPITGNCEPIPEKIKIRKELYKKRCANGTQKSPSGRCLKKNKTKKNVIYYEKPIEEQGQQEQQEQEQEQMPIHEIIYKQPLITDLNLFQENIKEPEPEEPESEISEFLESELPSPTIESVGQDTQILDSYDFLYPELDDPEFAYKIAQHKEFNDTQYDGEINDIQKQSELLCNSDFELMPHQLFVKNFLSFQTPYNSLLLYHGLGSGKTYSAIGVCEEMRLYMKQIGIYKQILVVASPNVQDNFKLQLFDERKLTEINGLWNITGGIGNALLQEINPTNLSGLTRERIISQINTIIRQNYKFMGYNEFANYITRKTAVPDDAGYSVEEQKEMTIKNIKNYFNNRLIVIDEIHNLALADKKQKRTSKLLNTIAKYSDNMRLLLLSATPMYNSYSEIIWLCNLMNTNDKRSTIEISDVFTSDGEFQPNGGRELLQRKLTGYVSYVRGENPYTFPYRVYSDIFDPEHSLSTNQYPEKQMNGKPIEEPLLHVPVYLNDVGSYQKHGYKFIMNYLFEHSFNRTDKFGRELIMPSFENMDTFGYTLLYAPLVALNIVYPNEILDKMIEMNKEPDEMKDVISSFIGQEGLSNIVTYKEEVTPNPLRHSYQYKPEILNKYGSIFSPNEIHKYSQKIATICDCVKKSKGIVLIYSQYIDGGAVPIALALEEMGFGRFGTASYTKNLFKKPPCEPIDALTMKSKTEFDKESSIGTFKQAKYVMITGHKEFSPNNYNDVNYTTNPENRNGELVKVIIISKAAAEGLDFKNIRQVHILEPWYNMNRIEQIIGRGVRNQSHCKLPFEERNVEIFLHSTLLETEEESADLYVYRVAEHKANQIGQVTRLLKEVAVDCLLNISQTNFTQEKLYELAANQNIKIKLSSGKLIDFKVGDKPHTDVCDYMDNCSFTCSSKNPPLLESDIIQDNYNTEFMKSNSYTLLKRIRDLFRERSLYHRKQLVAEINAVKTYPSVQIYYALTYLIENKTEELVDKYGRIGHLINRGDYYIFQPNEITDENASIYERVAPVDYKRTKLLLELPPEIRETMTKTNNEMEKEEKTETQYNSILEKINETLDLVVGEKIQLKSGETDWYIHLNNVLVNLKDNHHIPTHLVLKYTLAHILDCLSFSEKMVLLNASIHQPLDYILSDLEQRIQEYFDEKMVEYRGSKKGIVLAKVHDLVYLVRENDEWVQAEPEDETRIRSVLKKSLVDKNDFFPIIAFMHPFKGKEMSVKIKTMNLNNRNNKGARIDQTAKPEIISKINSVVGKEIYTVGIKDKAIGLAAILEILMRYKTDKGEAVMFFSPENALMNGIVEA